MCVRSVLQAGSSMRDAMMFPGFLLFVSLVGLLFCLNRRLLAGVRVCVCVFNTVYGTRVLVLLVCSWLVFVCNVVYR